MLCLITSLLPALPGPFNTFTDTPYRLCDDGSVHHQPLNAPPRKLPVLLQTEAHNTLGGPLLTAWTFTNIRLRLAAAHDEIPGWLVRLEVPASPLRHKTQYLLTIILNKIHCNCLSLTHGRSITRRCALRARAPPTPFCADVHYSGLLGVLLHQCSRQHANNNSTRSS